MIGTVVSCSRYVDTNVSVSLYESDPGSYVSVTVQLDESQKGSLTRFSDNLGRVLLKCAQHGFDADNGDADWPVMASALQRIQTRNREEVEPLMRLYIRAGAALRTKHKERKRR